MKTEILYPVTRTYLTRTLYLRGVTQLPTPLKKILVAADFRKAKTLSLTFIT